MHYRNYRQSISTTLKVKRSISIIVDNVKADSKFLTNIASLGIVQSTNFILPILIYPYLFRVVGDRYFGAIAYSLNIMIYLMIFTDYGFNLSAPRSISQRRDSLVELSQIVSRVLQTKLYFFLLCCLVVILSISFIPRFADEYFLYCFGLLYVAGSCLLPVWLFQGMEDMRHITWINLIAKVSSVVLIVSFVQGPTEYKYVVGLFGVANAVSGCLGIAYAFQKYKLRFYWQPVSAILNEISTGWHIFSSNLSTVMFSNSVLIILGFFVTNEVIGRYGIAEKITFAVLQLISVFMQGTYPILCRLALNSHKEVIKFMRKYYFIFILFVAFLCVCIIFFAEELLYIATGDNQPDTVIILRVLSFLPFIVCLNMPAYQMLLIYKKEKYNAMVFNTIVVVSFVVCTLLSATYGVLGAAVAALVTQILVTLSLNWVLEKYFSDYTLWLNIK